MSNSRRPPVFGEVPTKVVIEGARPGDPNVQLLFRQLQGEISRFHGKARQNREISGQPQLKMQQALPNGGQVRYVYNNGQEALYVSIEPPRPVVTTEPQPKPKPEKADPVLAIDITFGAPLSELGSIYTATETVTWIPPTPDRYEPDVISLSWWTAGYDGIQPGPIPEALWPTFFAGSNAVARGHVQNVGTPVIVTCRPGASMSNRIRAENFAAVAAAAAGPDQPATPTQSGAIIRSYVPITFGDPSGFWDYGYGNGIHTVYYMFQMIQRGQGVIPGLPGREVRDRQVELREYNYFANLIVTGAKVKPAPDKPAYSALSTGASTGDDRLRPAQELSAGPAIVRQLSIADDSNDQRGLCGAGFVVKPVEEQQLGGQVTKTTIDLYIASANIKQQNRPDNALPHSQMEVDDPSMEYNGISGSGASVRVREFTDETPVAVQVTVNSERRMRLIQGSSESGPTEEVEMSNRKLVWYFAASAGWTDNGGIDPSNPDAVDARGRSTMGKLLAQRPVPMSGQALLEPPPREFVNELRWPAGIDAMTGLCRVIWTPAERPGENGKVEIEGGLVLLP